MITPSSPFPIVAWLIGDGPIDSWRDRLEAVGCRRFVRGTLPPDDLQGSVAVIVADVAASVADPARLLEFHRGHEAPITRLLGPDGEPAGLVVASVEAVRPEQPGWAAIAIAGPTLDWTDAPASPRRPAVFLDRDGTVIEEVHYLADPARVRLIPGAAEALRLWESLGFARVIVSNQSGVGRGLLTLDQMNAVNAEMTRQLADQGASIDAIETCTDAPIDGETEVWTAWRGRRKPGPGMLCHAAATLGLDLARSWAIGDMLRDLKAGQNAGCTGSILVRTGKGKDQESAALARARDREFETVDDLLAAAERLRDRADR